MDKTLSNKEIVDFLQLVPEPLKYCLEKKDGGACTLKNSHRYTFFHEDSEIIVDALKQHFSSLEG